MLKFLNDDRTAAALAKLLNPALASIIVGIETGDAPHLTAGYLRKMQEGLSEVISEANGK